MTHPTIELNDMNIYQPLCERPITSKPWRIAWVIGGLVGVVGAMVIAVHVAGALQ